MEQKTMTLVSEGAPENLEKITRVEIIDDTGRVYVNTHCYDVSVSVQDGERTLKLFLKNQP